MVPSPQRGRKRKTEKENNSVRDCRLRSEEGTIDLGWKNPEMIFKLGLEGRVRTER